MEYGEVISPVASELARSCEIDLAQTCFQCGYKEDWLLCMSFTELSIQI
jgi:hypothetical protein